MLVDMQQYQHQQALSPFLGVPRFTSGSGEDLDIIAKDSLGTVASNMGAHIASHYGIPVAHSPLFVAGTASITYLNAHRGPHFPNQETPAMQLGVDAPTADVVTLQALISLETVDMSRRQYQEARRCARRRNFTFQSI